MRLSSSHPHASTAVALFFCLFATPLWAQTAPVGSIVREASAPGAETSILKHLPAGHDDLVFRGENATREWSIFLGHNEVARISIFQLALLNTVALLPDRSSLKLTINGHVITSVPVHAPDKVTNIPVKIPTGVLVPGFNTVQVSVALAHRVDCSVKATYELWALLNPAQTGFVLPSGAAYSVRSLAEVAGEPLADDGTTRIHLRLEDGPDATEVARAGRFIDALVASAKLVRPVVDVGPGPGSGPGFDVVLATGSSNRELGELRVIARDNGIAITREPTSNRLVLVVIGTDTGDLDQQVAALEKIAPGIAAPLGSAESTIEGEFRRTFAELGFASESFAGRHYLSGLGVTLPTDFYPGNYDRARLLIDGAHSAALDGNSEIVFRVNGTLVSSLRLASGAAARFQHEIVDLPLRFFHPGHNDIGIEAVTASPFDAQCDLASMPRDPRLIIAGSSELEFPHFAHLGTRPQIPAALYGSRNEATEGVNLYLSDAERQSVGAGLTVLANVASLRNRTVLPTIHFAAPTAGDVPGIVIAPYDQLPENLSAALRKVASPTPIAHDAAIASVDTATTIQSGADKVQARGVPSPMEEAASINQARFEKLVETGFTDAQVLLRNRGFFFSGADTKADVLPLTQSAMLVAAVGPEASSRSLAGIELPRFTNDAAEWLVVTASAASVYQAGLERLVVNGQWKQLGGQAASLNLETNELRSVQPSRVSYVVPSQFVAADVRPILGGIVSNNIVLSMIGVMLLMSILGLSTHGLIRRMGAR